MGVPRAPASSRPFSVQAIPHAGRGAIAKQRIPRGTQVLKSEPPTAHVIFRQYRKEVCARCLYYDCGRHLPVRHAATGKVFCSADCQSEWLAEEGPVGVKAWECLQAFIQLRTKDMTNCCEDLPDRGGKPGRKEIGEAWQNAEERKSVRSARGKKVRNNSAKEVDAGILGYLLSNILAHHRDPDKWREQVEALALVEEPYHSTHELAAHTDSLLHLSTILPEPVLDSCTPEICHLAVAAASHNSFGIRSEDGEEYMGYALYPDASYFNHSCMLNVSKTRQGRHWVFTADRDIEAGEECSITYLGGDERDMDVGERRARLMEHWGFECMCGRCCEESRNLPN